MGQGSVGIVGLGIMGGAIARNLVERGWRVVGFDVSPERRDEAQAHGVALAADVAELVRQAPLILTSLPGPEAAAATAKAIAAAEAGPRVVAEASTLALEDKLAFETVMAAAGHAALDCPLSGTGAQARSRDLVVYASGARDAIARAMPVFADFAREAHDLGRFGNGTRMKLVANLLVAIHNVASAEAMVLGMKAGLDPDQIVKLVSGGAGTSRIFELRAPMMAADRYEPATMKTAIWQKDMDVIRRFAAELGVETPLFSASGPIYEAAVAAGLGAVDTACVCRVIESRSGLRRREPA
ncbi:NAD(P)-dependent oxidoreductase [Enterovirga aerilata]|uniref:NAD(P)-dependent oxidoreductase n=1 Tax=Enterovirga aerilata TaxID=2730920 RepID=A0A849I3K0_9HYPH|nr:NAD(P)-dependent oxidoreductase [Enterovirga sp. DB1703]NNM70955.1 NAD(P)-dependent oxidoreductase [Enterovirga sp. DB1703]